jgi:hypothetical protein
MFPVYGGKCLSRKVVHNWVEKFSQERSKVADDARPGRPVQIATEADVQRVEVFGVSTHLYIVRYYVICHISRTSVCVRSTPWCGSTLGTSCIAICYFAFGEEAQFGLS